MASTFDGCLCNFTDRYARLLSNETGIQFPKASSEWPPVWYWERDLGVTQEQERTVWERDILARGTNFWLKLKPIEGAGGVIRRLNELTRVGNGVYFLTNRMGDKAKLQTERWLFERGMDYPTVLLSGDKVPLIKALGIEFFIDDKPDTVQDVHEHCPGVKVFIKDMPYNRMVQVGKRVQSVEDALKEVGLW